MRSSDDQWMNEYNKLLKELTSCLLSLSAEYIESRKQQDSIKESCFAHGIIKVLLQNLGLLRYTTNLCKNRLVDSIERHTKEYVENLTSHRDMNEVALFFQTNSVDLIDKIKSLESIQITEIPEEELETFKELISKVTRKCQLVFEKPYYNQEYIVKLQAMAIALNMPNLSVTQKINLMSKIFLIKELWYIDIYSHVQQNFKLTFNTNIADSLQNLRFSDEDSGFHQIIKLFVDDNNILQTLTNKELTEIYDRLKNSENNGQVISNLLYKIHYEAQFRYTHSRLSDSEYELLKRFQSYDAISYQVENSEFTIVESFLLRNHNFLQEVVVLIAKHLDNIKAVQAFNLSTLTSVIDKLKLEFLRDNNRDNFSFKTLSSIDSKLQVNLDIHVLNRYSELDQFEIESLKNKYFNLFNNINYLLDGDNKGKIFLQQVVVHKIAQDYYVNNYYTSINKLRSMVIEREEINKELSEIDFVDLFSNDHLNSITSLNFRKKIVNNAVNTPAEYVMVIIKILISETTSSQLISLYKSTLKKKLTTVQIMLRQVINNEIKQRTRLSKMIYSIITGKKSEIDSLRTIKRDLQMM